MAPVILPVAAAVSAALASPIVPPPAAAPVRAYQPVHEYFTPFGPATPAADRDSYGGHYTHLGTDFGSIGPAGAGLGWEEGGSVRATLPPGGGEWAGVWHSLAGLARQKHVVLDLTRCYPDPILPQYQPVCRGVTVRARGQGAIKLEIKTADQRVIWQDTVDAGGPGQPPVERWFDPAALPDFRRAKFLNWAVQAQPDRPVDVSVDAVGLVVEFPPAAAALPFEDRVFLLSYAKLARCAVPGAGLVRDQAQREAGAFECVPASGMWALATAAAWERGVVDRAAADRTLREVREAVDRLPKADGWLPHFVSRPKGGGPYRIHPGTEFSTVDTSLTYHGLLAAARVLGDKDAEREILADVRALRFDRLRAKDGYLLMGFQADGRTPLLASWKEWGGEAALVKLLERLALGDKARVKVDRSGRVPDGVGFVAEVQSLFYPQFDADGPDALTGVNWRAARDSLVRAQLAAVARHPAGGRAAEAGLFGLSAGEGFRGRTYVAFGTRTGPARRPPARPRRRPTGYGGWTPWACCRRGGWSRTCPWTWPNTCRCSGR